MADKQEGLHQPAPTEKTGPLVGSLNLAGNGESSAVPAGLSANFWLEGGVLKCEGVIVDARGKLIKRKRIDASQPVIAKFFGFFTKLVS